MSTPYSNEYVWGLQELINRLTEELEEARERRIIPIGVGEVKVGTAALKDDPEQVERLVFIAPLDDAVDVGTPFPDDIGRDLDSVAPEVVMNIVDPDGAVALLEEIFHAIDNAGGMTQPKPTEVKGWPVEARRALLERDALRGSNDDLRAEVEGLRERTAAAEQHASVMTAMRDDARAEVERLTAVVEAAEGYVHACTNDTTTDPDEAFDALCVALAVEEGM